MAEANIFGGTYGVQWTNVSGQTSAAYILLDATGGSNSTKSLATLFLTRAPANNIVIDQGVDSNIQKNMKGDFLVSTFGHKLTEITISGIDMFTNICVSQVGKQADTDDTIKKFYKKYNVHDNNTARVTLTVDGIMYKTIVTDLTCEMDTNGKDALGISAGKYTLTLQGVRTN